MHWKKKYPSGAIVSSLLVVAALVNAPNLADAQRRRMTGAQTVTLVPIAPVSWKDISGKKYDIETVKKNRATVFFFSSTQCPIANLYTPRMVELAKAYASRGVQFFLVNSNMEDSLATVRRYVAERGFPFPAVKDNGTALADHLIANRTPEAIILDSKAIVRYRGGIDDNVKREKIIRHSAKDALEALLAGKEVERPRTAALGCTIFRDNVKTADIKLAKVSYTKDIAPILNRNCVDCHRPGEVGPFSLETYQQAKTWASAIKDYTTRRQMPPWKAVAGVGDFHDARVLNDKEIAVLAKWADSGAPRGEGNPPALPKARPGGWILGEPGSADKPGVVLASTEAYQVPAEGRDIYRQFILPVDTDKDQFLKAIEFQADNRAIVHHMIIFWDLSGMSVELDKRDPGPGYSVSDGAGGIGVPFNQQVWVSGWAPGNTARLLPEGLGIRLPKGAKVVLQVHYHPNGKAQMDRSRVAFHYTDDSKVTHEVQTGMPLNPYLSLKPGVARQRVTASQFISEDTQLLAVSPHMHMLGREMKMTAELPDGKQIPLVLINDWDFNWQETYRLKKPMDLPKGSKILVEAYYDNSENNPRQPSHPPKLVRWGEETTDEMCIGFFTFTKNRNTKTVSN